jgi:hypothetical protein
VRVSTYDLILVFPAAALRMGQLRDVGIDASARLAGVDLYYRAETDVALVALRLDARTATQPLLERLRAEAETAGAVVLETARLDDAERARFYATHLLSYPFSVGNFPTVSDALRKLASDFGWASPGAVEDAAPQVEVRVRRGNQWILGRVRRLGREGVYVHCGSAPRVRDVVDLRFATAGVTAALRAEVVHVTHDDAAIAVGGAGFEGRFLLGSHEERQQLEALVLAGRSAGLGTARLVPSRREARYLVRWPVALDGSDGGAETAALDVSLGGMFLPVEAPLGTPVAIRLADDEGAAPIQTCGHVARRVTDEVARQRCVSAGIGIEIDAFRSGDEARFRAFIARVGRRAARHVVVGADLPRLPSILDPLVAAGYVASGVATAAEVVEHATKMHPDLLMIDRSLVPSESAARRLRRALIDCSSPSVPLDGPADDASIRAIADAALLG